MEKKFTKLQQRFIEEYPNHSDQTKAYVAAGGSVKTARTAASKLMTNPKIKAEIDKIKNAATKKANVTTDMIVEELKRMAFFRPEDFLFWNEEKQEVETRITKENMHLVKGITSLNIIKGLARFGEDKSKALEMLAKYKGMFDKDDEGDKNMKVTINYVRTNKPDRRTAKDVIT